MMMNKTYQIRIDNRLYEGSQDLAEAEHLYRTVDQTCLRSYDGCEKTLVEVSGSTETVHKRGIIKCPCRGMRL